jgi:hypothetical protein
MENLGRLIYYLLCLLMFLNCAKEKITLTNSLDNSGTLSTIIISPDSAIKIIGSNIQFNYSIIYTKMESEKSNSAHWISSDTSIATIDSTGLAICKSVGKTYITAQVDSLTSNSASLNIIRPTILVGQTEGMGISYTNLGAGIGVTDVFLIDINNNGLHDFVIDHKRVGGNNRDIIVKILPLSGNQINFNTTYKSVADSILLNKVDTTLSGFRLWFPADFEIWADTVSFNTEVNGSLSWINHSSTLFYHYARDAIAWGYDFGLWTRYDSRYLALKICDNSDTTFAWLSIKIQNNGDCDALVFEYAGIKTLE